MKKWVFGVVMMLSAVWASYGLAATTGSAIVDINDDGFPGFIRRGVCVVEFFLPGCPACKRTAPEYEKVAFEMADEARFAKLNLKGSKVAKEEKINMAPTFIIYEDGEEIGRRRGAANAATLRNFFSSVFNRN